ncbi:hypothetical protein KC324_g53 [Hortaea werneckii]|nr:hypothetical protein KC324_g53 [Hortaea werneckii]
MAHRNGLVLSVQSISKGSRHVSSCRMESLSHGECRAIMQTEGASFLCLLTLFESTSGQVNSGISKSSKHLLEASRSHFVHRSAHSLPNQRSSSSTTVCTAA